MLLRSRSVALLKKGRLASARFAGANKAAPFAIRAFSAASNDSINEIEFTTMVEMFEKSMSVNADKRLFASMVEGEYKWISYREFEREVQKFRNVLAHHNFGHDDKVSVICNNRVEWAVIALAAAGRGGHIVPMYEAQLESDWRYIIEDSDTKLVVAANERIYNKVKEYVGTVGKVEAAISLDCDEALPHSYKHWMAKVADEEAVEMIHPSEDDLMTIIYTSGTTGKPKGVELSHRNIVTNLMGLKDIWGTKQYNVTSLAFLPWAHVFGQTCELYSMMANGSGMAIVPNREAILESLPMVKPSLMCSVPTLFNKVYDGVMVKMANESPLKQKLFRAALANSRARSEAMEFGRSPGFMVNLKHGLFDKIIFSKIRDRFGGNLK